MIFHLLIVDDEPTIRKGLSSFIQWDSLDCVVDDTACDGTEAMELIRMKQPNIVISDIKMPQADGIALSKFIYEQYPQIKVILLTGYADFRYAQSAIRYAVSDFILKPTSKEKLIEAVKKAQTAIAEIRNRTVINKEDWSYLQEQYLEELTGSVKISPEMLSRSENYQVQLQNYVVAAFQLNEFLNGKNGQDLNLLKEVLADQGRHHYAYRYGNHLVLWVYQVSQPSVRASTGLKKICTELLESIYSLYAVELSVGISHCHQGISELSAAAKEAIGALNMNFYNDCAISVFEQPSGESDLDINSEYTLDLYNFENMMKLWEFDSALKSIHVLFSKLRVNLTRSYEVKNICIQIYYICSRILIKKNLIPPVPDILHKIQECATIGQLELLVNQLYGHVVDMMTTKGKELSILNEKAVLFIHSHMSEQLSLEMISDHVHVNSSHLSRTFKKECGESITEYINKVRIEKAQELLSFSNTLAYEVAEKVGFHDPAYFSATFKKYTGLSPKEFKQFHAIHK